MFGGLISTLRMPTGSFTPPTWTLSFPVRIQWAVSRVGSVCQFLYSRRGTRVGDSRCNTPYASVHNPTADIDRGDAAIVDRNADVTAAIDVTTHSIDDSPTYMFLYRSVRKRYHPSKRLPRSHQISRERNHPL